MSKDIMKIQTETDDYNEERITKAKHNLILKIIVAIIAIALVVFGVHSYFGKSQEIDEQKITINEQTDKISELNKTIEDLKIMLEQRGEITIVEDEESRLLHVSRQVEKALQKSSELTTIKHRYEAVGIFKDVKKLFKKINLKFTETTIVYVYSGVVTAGIDLEDITIETEITENEEKIVVTLPEVEILDSDVEADSFRFPYVDVSVLNPKDMEDYIKVIDSLEKEKKEQMLLDKEFIKSAEDNCKNVIEGFFRAAGVECEIEFK